MIKEAPQNKMQKGDTDKAVDILTDFFFPEYSITIKASSQEEAESKLQEIIKNKQ